MTEENNEKFDDMAAMEFKTEKIINLAKKKDILLYMNK